MYKFAIITTKPIFQINLMNILLQSLLACFNLYKLLKILQTKSFQFIFHP